MKKTILKVMLGTIILEVVLVCLFILIGNFDSVTLSALGSVSIIFGYSIPCLFYSKIYDDEKYKYIAISGASLACLSALISILNLWNLINWGELLSQITATVNVIVWMLALVSWILSYVSVNNLFNLFKKVSISLITILSLFIIVITWSSYPAGFLSRLYYVLVVLTAGSFICTLILTKIYQKEIVKISQNKDTIENNEANSSNDKKETTDSDHKNNMQ